VKAAASPSDFLANPMGRYCVGRRHCVFAATPSLLGFASWGRPGVEDVAELLHLCAVGLEADMPRYRWLVDLRGLESVEPATFGLFVEYTRKNAKSLQRNIDRQAQLRPDGLVGAIISGFSRVARLSYPDRVFADVAKALAWLGVEHDEGTGVLAELSAIRDEARERHDVIARLRDELRATGALPAPHAAKQLGLSTRALQRALREGGTTYRMELKAFQMRRAQELLRGEETLALIAGEVGFSSAQHFATAFRRATGDTPSAWRTSHRP
jgi:AraC-like DNA-binding protein